MAQATETVLITGTNRGIGFGLTKHFARRGWRVFSACRRPAEAKELQALAREYPGLVEILPVEVRDDASVAALGRAVAGRTATLDMLINNAGILPGEDSERAGNLSLKPILEAFDVNVAGVIRVTQAVLPLLRVGSRPRIVNISSGGGSLKATTFRRHYSYSLSKAALNMFTRRAAFDLKDAGITVVSVSPGFIITDMARAWGADLPLDEATDVLAQTFSALQPAQNGQWIDRFGQPSEFAW
jgi:NAD(P)-dependent dehydrogenase (short-subunit alcohol dehydrogenase family)